MPDLNFFFENNPLHLENDQCSRQKAALKLNVKSVDESRHFGIINDYEVTLDSCNCRDYFVRKLPCKHMYRLAHELGLFHLIGNVVNDSSVKNNIALKEEKQRIKLEINNLDDESKNLLGLIISGYLYHEKLPYITLKTPSAQNILLKNLVKETFDLDHFFNQITRSDLVMFLNENQCKTTSKTTKAFIVEELKTKYPDVLQKLLSKYFILIPADQYIPHLKTIYNLIG